MTADEQASVTWDDVLQALDSLQEKLDGLLQRVDSLEHRAGKFLGRGDGMTTPGHGDSSSSVTGTPEAMARRSPARGNREAARCGGESA